MMKNSILKFRHFFFGLMFSFGVFFLPVHAQHIAAGDIHSLYVDPEGNVWIWGRGSLASATNKRVPHHVMNDAEAVFSDPYETLSFVIKKDGSLWGWGRNWYGQLGVMPRKGDDVSEYIVEPREVTRGVTCVSGAESVFALKPDKTLWAWGHGAKGRGDGLKKDIAVPVKIMDKVKQVSSSNTHTLALKTDGSLFAWGDNQCGALGIGNTDSRSRPVRVNLKPMGKRTIVKIAARSGESFAIADDGSVWGWGERNIVNPFCKDDLRLTPVRIDDMDNVKDVALGYLEEIYLKKDGSVWQWGEDPRHPNAESDWHKVLDNVKEIAAGGYHFIALKNDGTVWTFGGNRFGQLGNGTTQGSSVPVQVFFPKK